MARLSKTYPCLIVMLLLSVTSYDLFAGPFSFRGKKISVAKSQLKWHSNLETAHKAALKSNKPMLLVFHADWCGYCKKLEATTLAKPDMVKYVNSSFELVHIDLDKQPKIARILEVESIPCSVTLSPDADLLGKVVGYVDSKQMRTTLEITQHLHKKLLQHYSK